MAGKRLLRKRYEAPTPQPVNGRRRWVIVSGSGIAVVWASDAFDAYQRGQRLVGKPHGGHVWRGHGA